MKIRTTIYSLICFLICLKVQGQTALKVLNIIEKNCANGYCHGAGTAAGGLDLEINTGLPSLERQQILRDRLYNINPENVNAASNGLKLIFPGDPYRSFLFLKINQEMEKGLTLGSNDGENMPSGGILRKEERELIRQWILYDSPVDIEVIDTSLIYSFYNGSSLYSVENPPTPPDSADGFQIHLGPFFLEQFSTTGTKHETEINWRYDTRFKEEKAIRRIDTYMGEGFSHHFILWHHPDSASYGEPYGIRKDNLNYESVMVTLSQYPDSMILPTGTSFRFGPNSVLDLNSHYINYFQNKVLSSDVYVNIFYQPPSNVTQEMHIDIYHNITFEIPNDGQEIEFSHRVNFPGFDDPVYLWGITGHTHKIGKDYDIFLSEPNGNLSTYIYDASCPPTGDPGCSSPFYDYEHPPMRRFSPFLPMIPSEGFIHKAKYLNNGADTIRFGPTTRDEMMAFIVYYVTDTTGIITDKTNSLKTVDYNTQLYPNPVYDNSFIYVAHEDGEPKNISIFDVHGKMVPSTSSLISDGVIKLSFSKLSAGIYFYLIDFGNNKRTTGKFMKAD